LIGGIIMKGIVSLAINPTIDKSSSVEFVVPERKLRCKAPTIEPGGGGVNVSRAIRKLGGESTLLYTAGGLTGDLLEELLAGEGLLSRRLPLAGMTRESFAVLEESTGQQYRFRDAGPMLKEDEVQLALGGGRLFRPGLRLSRRQREPSPRGADRRFYAQVARAGRGGGGEGDRRPPPANP
jgi:6-phosphofructokinase 2